MKRAREFFWRLLRYEGGADAVEYALVAAVLAFAVIAGEASMAAKITSQFNMIGNSL